MRVHIFPDGENSSVVTLPCIPAKGDLFRRIVTTDDRGSSRTDTREVLSVMWVAPDGEEPYASLVLGEPR